MIQPKSPSEFLTKGTRAKAARILQQNVWGKPMETALSEVDQLMVTLEEDGYLVVPQNVLRSLLALYAERMVLSKGKIFDPTMLRSMVDYSAIYEYTKTQGREDGERPDEWLERWTA